MKILVVQESDWIKRGPHNSHHLFERLSERGHEVKVIDYEINWKDNREYRLISSRREVRHFHKLRDKADISVVRPAILQVTPLNYLSILYTHRKEIKRQIAEFKPDVVVGLGVLNAYIAIGECRKNRIPFIYFILDALHTLIHEKIFQEFAKWVEGKNYRRADLTIAVNRSLQDYIIGMGAEGEKTALLPHGIEAAKFAGPEKERENARMKYGFKSDDVVLFFMGYLYGFSGLVQVAEHLTANVSKYPRMKLFIVGEGPAYEELKAVGERVPGRITVLGWQPYSEIPSMVSASDVCILPSDVNDTMRHIVPIKILEYMASGKPVITTRLPGVAREFEDGSGISFVDRPEDVVEKAAILTSSGVLAEEGVKCRRSVTKRDWEDLTVKFEKILYGVVGKNRSNGIGRDHERAELP